MDFNTMLEPQVPEEKKGRLCLTLRFEDVVHIGPDISVQIIKTGRSQMRLMIDAPRTIAITREPHAKRDAVQGKGGRSSKESVWRRDLSGQDPATRKEG